MLLIGPGLEKSYDCDFSLLRIKPKFDLNLLQFRQLSTDYKLTTFARRTATANFVQNPPEKLTNVIKRLKLDSELKFKCPAVMCSTYLHCA